MKSIEQLEKEHRRRMQQDRKYRDKIVWAAQGGLLDGITTPKNVTEGIRLFCERISGGHESRIVPVEPYSWSRVSC